MIFGKKTKPQISFGEKTAFKIKKTPSFTIKPSKKVKDVVAFHQGTEIPVNTREDLKEIVEEPCLKACQELFDKNIQTMDSGCNGENCYNWAYIEINYDTLDKNNQKIADNMVNGTTIQFFPKSDECVRHYFNTIYIKVPTNPEEEISKVKKNY